MEEKSRFTGGAFGYFGIRLLKVLACVFTLGLAYPPVKCYQLKWEMEHTYYNNKKLVFNGNAGSFFGKYIIWLILSLITCGLYYMFAMKISIKKWQIKYTQVEGVEGESKFNGSAIGFFGVGLLTKFVTIITLGLGSFWARCYKERWIANHTVISGYEMKFKGLATQYFGKKIVWLILTLITCGIYSFFLAVNCKKWIVKHTFFIDETEEKEEENLIPSRKGMKVLVLSFIGLFMPILLFVGNLIISIVALIKGVDSVYIDKKKRVDVLCVVLSSILLILTIICTLTIPLGFVNVVTVEEVGIIGNLLIVIPIATLTIASIVISIIAGVTSKKWDVNTNALEKDYKNELEKLREELAEIKSVNTLKEETIVDQMGVIVEEDE